jgi:hypothetical protein
MKIDPKIRLALDESSVPYEVVKKKDHYFAQFDTGQRIIIAGNHGKQRHGEIVSTVQKIRKIGEKDE